MVLRCREVDRKHVEAVLEEAKKEYAEKAKLQAPKVTIDDKVYLPPPQKNVNSHEPHWYCSFFFIHKYVIISGYRETMGAVIIVHLDSTLI